MTPIRTRTRTRALPLVALALAVPPALSCGGDAGPEGDAGPAAETGAAAETRDPGAPGLPNETTEFRPTGSDSGEGTGNTGLTGTLWVATSQPGGPDGISLVAQLRNVPTGQAYAWALHRGDCAAPDRPVLPLGYGTEATGEDEHRAEQGGPLGEARAAFQPSSDGTAEETVWVPFDGAIDRARFEAEPYSLRIHPSSGTEALPPSVACAPVPVVRSTD